MWTGGRRVRSWRDDEVVLEVLLRSVEDGVDAGVDVFVADRFIGRDVSAPGAGVFPDQIVDLAGTQPLAGDPAARGGSDELDGSELGSDELPGSGSSDDEEEDEDDVGGLAAPCGVVAPSGYSGTRCGRHLST